MLQRSGFDAGLKSREILEWRFVFKEKQIVEEVCLQRCFDDEEKKKIRKNEKD